MLAQRFISGFVLVGILVGIGFIVWPSIRPAPPHVAAPAKKLTELEGLRALMRAGDVAAFETAMKAEYQKYLDGKRSVMW